MRLLAAGLPFALLAGVALAAAAAPATIPLALPSGKVLQAELMRTPQERALGVMFRPSLPEERGLLFLFDRLDFHSIWMKNCRFPIDIVWLDEQATVVHLEEAAPPCRAEPCPVYEPLRQALYVLEINAGQARREGVTIGSKLSFRLPR